MRYLEFFNEAAMNPTEFERALTAASDKNVLVGFEFEFYVPESSVRDYLKDQNLKKSVDPRSVADIATTVLAMGSEYANFQVEDIDKLDQLLKLKKPLKYKEKTATSFKDIYSIQKDYQNDKLVTFWDSMPKKAQKRILELWQESDAYTNGNDLKNFQQFIIHDRGLNKFAAKSNRHFDLVLKLGRLIRRTLDTTYIINSIGSNLGFDKFEASLDFIKLFKFDPLATNEYFKKFYVPEDYLEIDREAPYEFVADATRKTYGADVKVFDEYHQSKKNLTSWYVEPDGSLDDSRDDVGLELVSPPLLVPQALDALSKFYAMAKSLELYSDDSTGLHINVSIPESIDILKLVLFTGDQYVLRMFDRELNEYAVSVYDELAFSLRHGQSKRLVTDKKFNNQLKIKVFNTLAKEISRAHSVSISDNLKYISFRHAGGNYIKNPKGISEILGRFVRAMLIASDPDLYREEYLKKIYQLFVKNSPAQQKNKEFMMGDSKIIVDAFRLGIPIIEVNILRKFGGNPNEGDVRYYTGLYHSRNRQISIPMTKVTAPIQGIRQEINKNIPNLELLPNIDDYKYGSRYYIIPQTLNHLRWIFSAELRSNVFPEETYSFSMERKRLPQESRFAITAKKRIAKDVQRIKRDLEAARAMKPSNTKPKSGAA